MAKGFWDDPDVQQTSEWMKFDSIGDGVEGTISKMGKRTWPDGNIGIELVFSEPDAPAVTANQVLLKQALFALKPEVGDHLAILLGAIEKRPGGKTLKRFKVGITRKDGSTETLDQTGASATVPF